MSFLDEDNICGQTLLRLVSRGSSIIAEILRMSDHIPPVFLGVEDPQQPLYGKVLFDFSYLKVPEKYEAMLNKSDELMDIDDEFQENMMVILERFYLLFESLYKYIQDLNKYIEDLVGGFYIQHSVDIILHDTDGKQLMSEALYLLGVMLMLMDQRIPGPARERIVIAYHRYKGESSLLNSDAVVKLCRSSGFVPSGARPADYPESLLARFPVNADVVKMVISRLQSDDVYMNSKNYPSPEHRSTALSTQASMLYVMLFFVPDYLRKKKATMREIVDKHFNDNWIIAVYMGEWVDLQSMWAPYAAANEALANTLELQNVREMQQRNARRARESQAQLERYLLEGVLTVQFGLDNINPLLNCLRQANVAVRWLVMHRKTRYKKFAEFILDKSEGGTGQGGEHNAVGASELMQLLLSTSQLEFKLKKLFQGLLDTKEETWSRCKEQTAGRMGELAQYFSGEVALTRVKRDDTLMQWFEQLRAEIESLNYSNPTLAGRQIQKIIEALEEVEQFNEIDTSLQIKQFLADSRDLLTQMIRAVGVRDEIMVTLDVVTDMSYAWQVINDYTRGLQKRVRAEPQSTVLLRAMFLKLASILDVPLVRIQQANSPDTLSVAEYYSGELIMYVRRVLEIIPVSVFEVLKELMDLQTYKLKPIPVKLETTRLAEFAQLDLRMTYRVSVFTASRV